MQAFLNREHEIVSVFYNAQQSGFSIFQNTTMKSVQKEVNFPENCFFFVCVCSKVLCLYLFQFGQSQRVVVFDFELHEAHVGGMSELRDDAQRREQSGSRKHRDKNKTLQARVSRCITKEANAKRLGRADLNRVWTLTMVFASAM